MQDHAAIFTENQHPPSRQPPARSMPERAAHLADNFASRAGAERVRALAGILFFPPGGAVRSQRGSARTHVEIRRVLAVEFPNVRCTEFSGREALRCTAAILRRCDDPASYFSARYSNSPDCPDQLSGQEKIAASASRGPRTGSQIPEPFREKPPTFLDQSPSILYTSEPSQNQHTFSLLRDNF